MPAKLKTVTKADGQRVVPRFNPALVDSPAAQRPDQDTPKLTMRQLRTMKPVDAATEIDVALLRKRLNLSQPVFARLFNLPVGTLRDWEQGRRAPEGAARALLKIIEKEPQAALRALQDA
jgi:DNA-binding transcriptional regulator YiaG